MKITVDLDYETVDEIFLQILYDGYETTYHCYEEDVQKFVQDPTSWAFKREDIFNSTRVLDAYEVLAKHFTAGTEAEKRLQAIRDRIEYKYKIAKGMSQVDE
jgi:hypothetical protein